MSVANVMGFLVFFMATVSCASLLGCAVKRGLTGWYGDGLDEELAAE